MGVWQNEARAKSVEKECAVGPDALGESGMFAAASCASVPDELKRLFVDAFGAGDELRPFVYASAPGRVELAGNHTDHQGGRVISASITRRAHALARPNGTKAVRLNMGAFGDAEINLADASWMQPVAAERRTSTALVRGMMVEHVRAGGRIAGFDMAVTSDVPAGLGVSSSAAFEMLVGRTLEGLFAEKTAGSATPIDMALRGVAAERDFFDKLSGAQDQIASAVGGVVAMDFSAEVPAVYPLSFDAETCAYALCLIDSRCNHSLYNDEYDAVPGDMRRVANMLGCERLGDVGLDAFLAHFAGVRERLGDKAALRALHYFEETERVAQQEACLDRGNFEAFLSHARASGASSAQYLQNVSPQGDGSGAYQPAMVILALCGLLLGDAGAYRIHGGGFGGGVLAFVAKGKVEQFVAAMNGFLGYEACEVLALDSQGAFFERLVSD